MVNIIYPISGPILRKLTGNIGIYTTILWKKTHIKYPPENYMSSELCVKKKIDVLFYYIRVLE